MNSNNNMKYFIDMYKATNLISRNFTKQLGNIGSIDSPDVSKLESIKKEVYETKVKLMELKTLVEVLSKVLFPGQSNKLSAKIDNLLNEIYEIENSIESMINTPNQELFDKLNENMIKYTVSSVEFMGLINETTSQFKMYISYSLKNKEISLEDAKKLLTEDELTQDQKDVLKQSIEEYNRENITEQSAVRDNEGSLNNTVDSLDNRLNNIKYDPNDIMYSSKVKNTAIGYQLEQIQKAIEGIEQSRDQNNHLSVHDAIALSTLKNQEHQLREMLANQTITRKEANNEVKMAKMDASISSYQDNIDKLRQERSNMNSRLFKGISMRKEKKLQAKLDKLNQKMGQVLQEQRALSLTGFDKKNKKMFKKSNRTAKISFVKNEFTSIKNDAKRFVHNSALMDKLRRVKLNMSQTPVTIQLNEPQASVGMSM